MSDFQTDEEWLAAYEKAYSRFRRRVPGEPVLATIARLSFMVNGALGRDWHSGQRFVLGEKGDTFAAICDAVAQLQAMRRRIEMLESGQPGTPRAWEWTASGDSEPFMRVSRHHPGEGGDIVAARPLGAIHV